MSEDADHIRDAAADAQAAETDVSEHEAAILEAAARAHIAGAPRIVADEEPAPLPRADRAKAFLRSMFRLAIERSHMRVALVGLVFVAVFGTISAKLLMMAIFGDPPSQEHRVAAASSTAFRPDIVDRNGEILATDIRTVSVFAEPGNIYDKDEAVELLTAVLPELNASELRAKLSSRKGRSGAGFVWVKRELTPKQQAEVHRLGIPGIGFLPDHKRVYPNGTAAAHILGATNLDGVGIAGIEKYIDSTGLQALNSFGLVSKQADLKPVQLSIDLRAQFAVRDELAWGIDHFKAKAGASMILDVKTGEVIALVSHAGLRPERPEGRALARPDQPHERRRLRDGLDLQGDDPRHGAGFRQVQRQLDLRHPRRRAELGPPEDPRVSRHQPGHHHAGGVHAFLEHRLGQDGARRRRARPQGVPEEDGPARPPAHRTARERGADRPVALDARSTRSPSRSATASRWRRSRPRPRWRRSPTAAT